MIVSVSPYMKFYVDSFVSNSCCFSSFTKNEIHQFPRENEEHMIKIAGSSRSEMETNCAAPSFISPFYQQCNAILLLNFGYLENNTLFFDIWLIFLPYWDAFCFEGGTSSIVSQTFILKDCISK